jgi:hypothetical protein
LLGDCVSGAMITAVFPAQILWSIQSPHQNPADCYNYKIRKGSYSLEQHMFQQSQWITKYPTFSESQSCNIIPFLVVSCTILIDLDSTDFVFFMWPILYLILFLLVIVILCISSWTNRLLSASISEKNEYSIALEISDVYGWRR